MASTERADPFSNPGCSPGAKATTGRPVRSLTRAGDEPDDSFMPAGVEQANAMLGVRQQLLGNPVKVLIGLRLHMGLKALAGEVQIVEARCQLAGLALIAGKQAVDAERHVRQPAGRVKTRRNREAQVRTARGTRVPP